MLHLDFPFGIILNGTFIPAHLFFELLAFFIAFRYYLRLRKKNKDIFNDSQRLTLAISAAIGAFLGSRLLAVIEHYDMLLSDPNWIFISQSKSILGALIGGIISIEITKKLKGIRNASGDIFVFPLIVGIIIGRIGCALSGVHDATVGLPSSLPWAFEQGDIISRHPTALYEILFLLILWVLLAKIQHHKCMKNGDLFKFFMIGYAGWRALIEFLKPHLDLLLGLSAIQIAACLVLLYYFRIFSLRYIQHKF